jgi:peptidoglycan/LPS O-acetylase OafA/YrhL
VQSLARASHIPAFDGLRALAVLAVFCFHTSMSVGGTWAPGGFIGADLFFALSGYLISKNLTTEWERTGRVDIGRFYLQRAKRLSPALLVFLATVVLVAAVLFGEGTRTSLDSVVALLGFMNWFRAFGGKAEFFDHLWSLSAEEQFYLVWPLAILGLTKVGAIRHFPLILVAAAVAIALWRVLLWRAGVGEMRIYHGLDTRADGLLLGSLVAFSPRGRLDIVARRIWPVAAATLIATALMVNWQSELLIYGGSSLVAIASATLVVAAADSVAGLRVLGWAPLRWLGKRSYSFYLWHFPIVAIIGSLGITLAWDVTLALISSLIAADLSYRLVEVPFLSAKPPGPMHPARPSASGLQP